MWAFHDIYLVCGIAVLSVAMYFGSRPRNSKEYWLGNVLLVVGIFLIGKWGTRIGQGNPKQWYQLEVGHEYTVVASRQPPVPNALVPVLIQEKTYSGIGDVHFYMLPVVPPSHFTVKEKSDTTLTLREIPPFAP